MDTASPPNPSKTIGASPVKTPPVTLTEAVSAFLEAKEGAGLSPKTLSNYQQELDRLSTFTGEKTLAKITPKDVTHYLSHCRYRNISRNTVASYYRTLRAFFNWCQRQDMVKHSPTGQAYPMEIRSCNTYPGKTHRSGVTSSVLTSRP